MSLKYDDCLKRGKIKQFSRGKTLAPKELEAAETDLNRAIKTYKESDYKWATVQVYYSMFHSARALLYAKNLREHSHYCLLQAMKSLYVDTNKISAHHIDVFQQAKSLREDADYYNRWSEEGCRKLLKAAEEFLKKAISIIK
jgi:uncharacterized protein (UPF0332 family)